MPGNIVDDKVLDMAGAPERLPRMPLRQTALRVPEDELERAKKMADEKGISLSEFLRRALAVQLAYEQGVALQAAYERGVEAGREQERRRRERS
jgi:Ribbon-helix-helix protein, copG family